jgi:hypothetical protein
VYNESIDLPSVMVAHDASITVANSIFANSVGGIDVQNVQYNGTATIAATGPNIASAAVANTGGTISGPAFTVANPNLGSLANNGGPTPTMAPNAGSPAIDAGSNAAAAGLTTDQRGSGFPRIVNGAVDIGAVEVQLPVVVAPTSLPTGRVTTAYSQTISATGPPGPFTFAVTSGSLPTGLTLSSGGALTGTPTAAGGFNFTIAATNAVAESGSQGYALTINLASSPPPPPPPPTPGSGPLVVSGSADGTAAAFAHDAGGQYATPPAATLSSFGAIAADVRTAVGDVNDDGFADTILVTGPGTPIRVAVISGTDNSTVLVPAFDPFGGEFTGGGFVAAADIDRDGRAEFVVTPDRGGGPRVSIFSLNLDGTRATRANFFGIDDPNFRGGARAALGDLNHDGTPDLAVAAGFLGGPRTALFDGNTLLTTPTKLIGDFFAFPGSDAVTLRNGVFVAMGDINGDGFADLIFGGGPGGAPRVFILSGAMVSAGDVAGAQANPIANFFVAGNAADRGGVRVATKDADGDGKADLAVGSGAGSPTNVRIYLGKNFTTAGEPATFQDLSPFPGAILADGIYVG